MKQKRSPVSRHRLEKLAWRITRRDYRTRWKGTLAVLVLGAGGTTLQRRSEFNEAELNRYLGKHDSP